MPDVDTISAIWSSSYHFKKVFSERIDEVESEIREVTQSTPGPWIADAMVKSSLRVLLGGEDS